MVSKKLRGNVLRNFHGAPTVSHHGFAKTYDRTKVGNAIGLAYMGTQAGTFALLRMPKTQITTLTSFRIASTHNTSGIPFTKLELIYLYIFQKRDMDTSGLLLARITLSDSRSKKQCQLLYHWSCQMHSRRNRTEARCSQRNDKWSWTEHFIQCVKKCQLSMPDFSSSNHCLPSTD